MVVASEVEARDDDQEEGMVKASGIQAEGKGKCREGSGEGGWLGR